LSQFPMSVRTTATLTDILGPSGEVPVRTFSLGRWSCLSYPQFIICSVLIYAAASWLRHYTTNRKVADSKPDEAKEFLSIYLILLAELDPGVYSASNKNKYQQQKSS
jgi:hypothetical protein